MNNQNLEKNKITPFAVTNYRDIRKRFGIKEKNRRGHMYIIGKTGTGKSTLIQNMVISDINQGNGVCLIDPHGDLAEDILNFIPKERIDDVIYLNPQDLEYPIPFNPVEKVHSDYHHLVTSGLISVFKKVWSEFWGPRLEHILRHSILTLLEYPNSTLLDLPRLLTDKDFRKKVIYTLKNQQVRDFWFNEFEKYSAYFKSEAISPILNKIGQFLTSLPLRNIVGQKENAFHLRKAMDEGKILIVNLSKGRIGEDNSSLLGAMIISKIQLAAMTRVDIPENQRKPFYLFVDEIHNFATLSFVDIMSELRKYGIAMTLANQYISQLNEKIRDSIFGNVGTLISFRIGAYDAKYLKKEFDPIIDESDLVNLPNFHIYLKLLIDGVTSNAFSACTLPPVESVKSYKNLIIEYSRGKYGKSRKDVEKEIFSNQINSVVNGKNQRSMF